MAFDVSAGLAAAGASIARTMGDMTLEMQRNNLMKESMVLADKLAGERESRGRAEAAKFAEESQGREFKFRSEESTKEITSREKIAEIGRMASIATANISAGATLGAAKIRAESEAKPNEAKLAEWLSKAPEADRKAFYDIVSTKIVPKLGEGMTISGGKVVSMPGYEESLRSQTAAREAGQKEGQNMPSPAQKAVDENFGKEYADYVANGGHANTKKLVKQLDDAVGMMEKKGANVSGPWLGMLPDSALAVMNPETIEVRDRIYEAVQANLRQVMGAQFTQKEGEGFMARSFNQKLSEAENVTRAKAIVNMLAEAAQAKQAAIDYYEKNGTLRGWQGHVPTMAEMRQRIDEMDKNRVQGETGSVTGSATAPPAVSPQMKQGAESQAPAWLPPVEKRIIGKIYQMPSGSFMWTPDGWLKMGGAK